jgi:hypothetical protein
MCFHAALAHDSKRCHVSRVFDDSNPIIDFAVRWGWLDAVRSRSFCERPVCLQIVVMVNPGVFESDDCVHDYAPEVFFSCRVTFWWDVD